MPSCVHARTPEESQPPNKQVKPLFRHFRRIDSCLQTRVAFRGSDESECGRWEGQGFLRGSGRPVGSRVSGACDGASLGSRTSPPHNVFFAGQPSQG